jgi:hypothetical protein
VDDRLQQAVLLPDADSEQFVVSPTEVDFTMTDSFTAAYRRRFWRDCPQGALDLERFVIVPAAQSNPSASATFSSRLGGFGIMPKRLRHSSVFTNSSVIVSA